MKVQGAVIKEQGVTFAIVGEMFQTLWDSEKE